MVHAVLHSKAVRSKNFLRLSFSALALYAAGSCYSADELTDGVLTREELVVAAPQFAIRGESIDAAIAELVAGGQLSEIEPGTYRYTDFLELNASRADVERKRQADNDRYAARQSGRKRKRQAESRSHSSIERDAARITDPTQTQQGVDSHGSYSSAPTGESPQADPDLSATRPTEISRAERERNAAAPPVPPLSCSSLISSSNLRDYPDQTPTEAGGGEGHLSHSDLPNPEGEADPKVNPLPKPPKGTRVGRREYQPSAELWAQWHTQVTATQWLKTVDRYHDKGLDNHLLYAEHESRFADFLRSTLRYAAMREREKQMRAERRAARSGVNEPVPAPTDALTPSVASEPVPPPPKRALSYNEQCRFGGKMVYSDAMRAECARSQEINRERRERQRAEDKEKQERVAAIDKSLRAMRQQQAEAEAEQLAAVAAKREQAIEAERLRRSEDPRQAQLKARERVQAEIARLQEFEHAYA